MITRGQNAWDTSSYANCQSNAHTVADETLPSGIQFGESRLRLRCQSWGRSCQDTHQEIAYNGEAATRLNEQGQPSVKPAQSIASISRWCLLQT